jgi:hypothetical protein
MLHAGQPSCLSACQSMAAADLKQPIAKRPRHRVWVVTEELDNPSVENGTGVALPFSQFA